MAEDAAQSRPPLRPCRSQNRGAGGPFRHGLEVACHAAQASQGMVFALDRSPGERRELEPRWRLAAADEATRAQGLGPLVTLPVWAWLDGRLAVIFGTLHQALARVALIVAWWPSATAHHAARRHNTAPPG
ncbi:MAG: TraI domain-containing protein [Gammaproteobacteria bacterium]|nr:TraI domain-containing protein [Gammaproteobacteria bacterium]